MMRSLINEEVKAFKVQAYHNGAFEEITKEDILGHWSVFFFYPADLIPDELDTLKGEMAQWSQQDEDVLSYALFPQVATDFFKYREAQQTGVDQTVADTENGSYPV